jgi:diguanylate cyclase (GGDEF)-like protein/PAS domain S-box-containing protein
MRMPPGWDGVTTIEHIWRHDPDVQVVICTAYSDHGWDDILDRLGWTDRLLILKKPFDHIEVAQLACALTEKWRLMQESRGQTEALRSTVEARTHELRTALRELRASEQRYALAAQGANDGLWDWDLEAGVVFYSARWFAILGEQAEGRYDSPELWRGRVHADDADGFNAALADHLAARRPHFQHEHRLVTADGVYRWVLARGLAVGDAAGKPCRIAGSLSDIHDRRAAEEQLRHDATHDRLTGLFNRAAMLDHLGECLEAAQREPDREFAMLFLDLDKFKAINDSMGHVVGDRLLVEVADRLRTCVRTSDRPARRGRDSVARLGGDEFVVILDGIHSIADAEHVAERIKQVLVAPIVIDGHEVPVDASIGIVSSQHGYTNDEDVLRDADTALYCAKAHGLGATRVFTGLARGTPDAA